MTKPKKPHAVDAPGLKKHGLKIEWDLLAVSDRPAVNEDVIVNGQLATITGVVIDSAMRFTPAGTAIGYVEAICRERTPNPHAVALGKLGGAVGGKSKSPAKVKASRANGAKAGKKRTEKNK